MQTISPDFENKVRPIDKISQIKHLKNMILIYGDEDIHTPVEMGERLQAKSNIETELIVFKKAAHLEPIKKNPELYFDKIISHFDSIFGASEKIDLELFFNDKELTY